MIFFPFVDICYSVNLLSMYEIFNKRQTGRNKQASVASEPQQLATRTDDSGIRFSDVKDALSPFTGDNDCTVAK